MPDEPKVLQVGILPDGASWSAHGCEVDYTSCGDTVEDAAMNFVEGLMNTFAANIKKHGHVGGVLKPRPEGEWRVVRETLAKFDDEYLYEVHLDHGNLHTDGLKQPFDMIQFAAPVEFNDITEMEPDPSTRVGTLAKDDDVFCICTPSAVPRQMMEWVARRVGMPPSAFLQSGKVS